jgi:signal transduction histidine kinase
MTKEAAHQLGTPLSSIYGWLQLLERQNQDNEEALSIVYEIENDVSRLKGIAERFNKIGSQPELKRLSLEPIIDEVLSYMERRLPQLGKQIEVRKSIQSNAKVDLNPSCFSGLLRI